MRLFSISMISLVLVAVFWNSVLAGQAPVSAVKLASYHVSKRAVHTVSDRFLSFTIDPNAIKQIPKCHQTTNATLNMARSLAPAYIRLAGPKSNKFLFQSNPNTNHTESSTNAHDNLLVSNAEWLGANEFFSKVGMNVVACVSGAAEHGNKNLDLSNILELITFSDKHNISLDWQLGYEVQRMAPKLGKIMGHDVARLRKILDVFPRYRDSLIIGPDMTSFSSRDDATFVRNYLTEAGDALNVFTWHPFSGDDDYDIYEMLSAGMTTMDNYLWIKDGVLKSTSKGVVPKKSIWIAESEDKDQVSNLTEAMTWIKRMGSAARLGASVYLRKPHVLSLYEPTPEYWVAVLYKSLVGKTVLDVKQIIGNGTNKIQMFSHCTQVSDKLEGNIINPMTAYERGSITVYGVNTASEPTRISFRVGLKGDETAHMYILSEDNTGDFPTTLLNKQLLGLSEGNELPMVSPKIRLSPKYLVIPARSIFFIVFPDAKCRACNQQPADVDSKLQNNVQEEEDTNTFTSNVMEEMEEENDQDAVYVSYPERDENNKLKLPTFKNNKQLQPTDPSVNIKYVTFSEDTWLSSFPEKMKEAFSKEKIDSIDKKDKSKAEKYRIFAQAMLGKRNSTGVFQRHESIEPRFIMDDDTQITNSYKNPRKSLGGRFKRSESDYKPLPNPSSDTSTYYKSSDYTKSSEDIVINMNERSVQDLYALPINDENMPIITQMLKNGEFNDTIPIVSIVRKSSSEPLESLNERTERSSDQPENSTVFQETHQTSVNLISSSTALPTISSEPITEIISQSTQLVANISKESSLEQNTTIPDILLESENSTISRGYRRIADIEETEVDDSIIGAARTKTGDRPNFGPVSPFPNRKHRNIKSKSSKDKLRMSHRNPTTEEIPTTSTQIVETSSELSPQSDIAVSPKESTIYGRDTETEDTELTTITPVSPSKEEISDDLVSRPKPIVDHKQVIIAEQDIEKIRQRINSLIDSVKSKQLVRPTPAAQKAKNDHKTLPNADQLREQYRQKLRQILEKNNARLDELRKRLIHSDAHLHKRELFKDLFDFTSDVASDTKEKLNIGWNKVTHWIGDTSEKIEEELKRTRRDVHDESVGASRSTILSAKNDDTLNRLKQQIEARKTEITHRLQKLAEEQKIKKAQLIQNLSNRPKRDLQQIKDKIQELKEHHETRRKEIIDKLKQKKSNRASHLTPKNKRSVPELREKLAEIQKQIQARHEELHKKHENHNEDQKPIEPVNNKPVKSKPSSIKNEDSRPAAKPKETHHLIKFEEPHHPIEYEEHRYPVKFEEARHIPKIEDLRPASKSPEEHHASRFEEPHHPTKTEDLHYNVANKTSRSTRRNSPKQKFHVIHRRDVNENQLGENAGSDLMKDLHFRIFLDPVLNAREDGASFDPMSSNQLERRKRSLTNNEIFDEEEIVNNNKIRMDVTKSDEEYRKIKLNRSNDLNKVNKDSDILNGSFVPIKTNDDDTNFVFNQAKNAESSSDKNQTCQFVNYKNIFSYFWCIIMKMFHNLM